MKRDAKDLLHGPRFPAARILDEEHQAIGATMRWAEAMLAGRDLEVSSPVEVDALYDLLVSFREHLANHFLLEDEGDFVAKICARRDDDCRLFRALIEEHPSLLRRLDAIVASLRSAISDRCTLARGVATDIHGLFADLRSHEARENEIVRRRHVGG